MGQDEDGRPIIRVLHVRRVAIDGDIEHAESRGVETVHPVIIGGQTRVQVMTENGLGHFVIDHE